MTTVAGRRLEPEWWERIGGSTQRWQESHPQAARVLSIVRTVLLCTFVAALVLTLILVPDVRMSFVQSLAFLLPVVILFVLARTKTVRWRVVGVVFSVSILLAILIALVTQAVSSPAMGGANGDGPTIAIASHFEEVGKLLPLVLLAALAPGRVRRFATVDWFLLGYAAGAGFIVAEEGARGIMYSDEPAYAIIHEVMHNAITGPALFLNPFDVSVLGRGFAMNISHPVVTGAIAGAIGIGIALWRARKRVLAVALPVVITLLVISIHALGNAGLSDLGLLLGSLGLPAPMTLIWFVTGRGYSMPWIAAALFIACLLIDVARRRRVGGEFPELLLPAQAAASARLTAWEARHGVAAKAVALVAVAFVQWWSDARIALSGYPRRQGEIRRAAAQRGRSTALASVRARQLAMWQTTPDDTVEARVRFRRAAIILWLIAAVYAVVVGLLMASLIGIGLTYPDDVVWPWQNIGGVFRFIEQWWNGQPWYLRTLMAAGLVGMLWLYGLPFGLAFARAGLVTYAIGHTSAAHHLAKNPSGAVFHYLTHRSPADMLADAADLGFTFVPGFLGLKGTGGDLTGLLIGDMTAEGLGGLTGIDTSIAEGVAMHRDATALGLDPTSVAVRPPTEVTLPPVAGNAPMLDTLPGEIVASRPGLAPSTAYDVAGRGTYFTDASGKVVLVQQSPGGDIGVEILNAKPGVEYVRDGIVYGVDDAGKLWMRSAR